MRKIYFFIFVCNLFCCINAYADEKPGVFVSILPQKYFVEQIGKELVNVNVMVGPGQNPVTYEPTPKQVAQLSNTKLYFKIDVPFEKAWMPKVRANYKELVIVDCCEVSKNLSETTSKHNHSMHSDPHIWTSPLEVIKIVEQMTEQLILIDSDNKDKYIKNTDDFVLKLLELDADIKAKTKKLTKREMIVSHPSWSFYAEEYGFVQIPIEQNGKEIQASSLSKLIRDAKQKKIKAVFLQPQFNNKAAELVANEIGAKLIQLDPLAYDYIANMQYVTDEIVKGLSYE